MSTSCTAFCRFQRRLLACASIARTVRNGCLQVRLRRVDCCLLLGDGNLIRLLVQLGEEISLMHAIVVIHQNAGDLSRNAGRNKRHVPIHVCVVGGDGIEHLLDPRDAERHENARTAMPRIPRTRLRFRLDFRASCGAGPDAGDVCAAFASWVVGASPFVVDGELIEPGSLLCSVMSDTVASMKVTFKCPQCEG